MKWSTDKIRKLLADQKTKKMRKTGNGKLKVKPEKGKEDIKSGTKLCLIRRGTALSGTQSAQGGKAKSKVNEVTYEERKK